MKILFKFTFLSTSLILFTNCSTPPKPTEQIRAAQKQWQENLEDDQAEYLVRNKRNPSAISKYAVQGTCGGLPRIQIKTAPGFCLGLVYAGEGMIAPRTALALDASHIVVTDLENWEPGTGRLHLLTWNGHEYVQKTLLAAKNMKDPRKAKAVGTPHLITRGPDGKIYLGGSSTIARIDPLAANVEASIEVLIENLPSTGIHQLKMFSFDTAGKRIFVNVGASTNVCQKEGLQGTRSQLCSSVEDLKNGDGQVRVYQQRADGSFDPQFRVYAKGLRNSMGLFWDPELKVLLQAENSRDAIAKFASHLDEKLLPHDEFNLVQDGGHYGWPYCYDRNLNSPEWPNIDCKKYQVPFLFLPPHSAPLALIKYRGDLFPAFYKDRMILALHGYEKFGHRIVTFLRDDKGLPTGNPLSIVYGWDTNGEQRVGSPSGMTEMSDGSLLIVEDRSRKVLRLFYDAQEGNGAPIKEDWNTITQAPNDPNAELLAKKSQLEEKLRAKEPPTFSRIQSQMIDKYCVACHGGAASPGIQLLAYDDVGNAERIRQANKAREILARISPDSGWPQMPPQGIDSRQEQNELVQLVQKWINDGMPKP